RAIGQARVANAYLRMGASGISAVVAMSMAGNLWPIFWFAGLVAVILGDRAVFAHVRAQADQDRAPESLAPLAAWMAAQSVYGNRLAPILWFSAYMPGETLAMMYMCGGLANAAATLRSSHTLSVAGTGTTIMFM